MQSNEIAEYALNSLLNNSTSESFDSQKLCNRTQLQQKLLDKFLEEILKNSFHENRFNHATNLLEKVVKSNSLNTLILNLYPINEGYSIEIQGNANVETEKINYEDDTLLNYFSSGQIPPNLLDLLDKINCNFFYDGCVIMEVRDYRKNINLYNYFSLHYVLLKPSIETRMVDINKIMNETDKFWTIEDKNALESQLLLLTSEPLCLNPNPVISILKSKTSQNGLKSLTLKRYPKFHDLKKFAEYQLKFPYKISKLRKHNFIKTEFANSGDNWTKKLKSLSFKCVDNWIRNRINYSLPQNEIVLVRNLTKSIKKPEYDNENTLIPVEDFILDTEDINTKSSYSKLRIKRASNNGAYFCQLSLNKEDSNTILFELGSYSDAESYVNQYINLFSDRGKRVINVQNNIIDKTQLKSFYEMNYQPNNKIDELTQQKLQNYFSAVCMKDKQLQQYYQHHLNQNKSI